MNWEFHTSVTVIFQKKWKVGEWGSFKLWWAKQKIQKSITIFAENKNSYINIQVKFSLKDFFYVLKTSWPISLTRFGLKTALFQELFEQWEVKLLIPLFPQLFLWNLKVGYTYCVGFMCRISSLCVILWKFAEHFTGTE